MPIISDVTVSTCKLKLLDLIINLASVNQIKINTYGDNKYTKESFQYSCLLKIGFYMRNNQKYLLIRQHIKIKKYLFVSVKVQSKISFKYYDDFKTLFILFKLKVRSIF